MKRTILILTMLFTILLNIYEVSTADSEPSLKITSENYTVTVKTNSLPNSCYIIAANYTGGKFMNVDIRKYKTETEIFNIPDGTEEVKVMVWYDMNNMKPVLKSEAINIKENAELDKKIKKIAKNLKSVNNQNVITYKTENNEPRAVIWTKGITAPEMSEFEKEVDITDPSYAFLFAEQDKGSGWYDVNKSIPQYDGADRNMCYAAVSANQLHWWLDQNKDNIDAYISSLSEKEITSEKKDKLAQLEELRNSYKGQSESGIYNLFRKYFESPVYAYNANLLNDFFINGYQVNTEGYVNNPYFFKWDPRGGFFYDVFETNILTRRYSAGDYTVFKRDIIYYMKDGQSIGIIHKTPTQNVTHIITLWGVEVDVNNEITALFVTDSDDYEQPKIGMKRMLLKKNSSGYPIITTKIDSNNTGAQITEFVPLSLGESYWNLLP